MISLYSGTPGSGKSLHAAEVIYWHLKFKKPIIANFQINKNAVPNPEYFTFIDTYDLSPDFLLDYAGNYYKDHPVKEGSLTVIIDEAQMIFNARDWTKGDRQRWNRFFQVHRHYGYDIILCSQFDQMLDKQLRSLIEYEFIHRKVSNFGWKGKLLSLAFLSPCLIVSVKMWYPMKEKVDSEFIRARKKYYKIYDTFLLFDKEI